MNDTRVTRAVVSVFLLLVTLQTLTAFVRFGYGMITFHIPAQTRLLGTAAYDWYAAASVATIVDYGLIALAGTLAFYLFAVRSKYGRWLAIAFPLVVLVGRLVVIGLSNISISYIAPAYQDASLIAELHRLNRWSTVTALLFCITFVPYFIYSKRYVTFLLHRL